MQIKPAQIEQILRKPEPNIRGYLFYGPNHGLVSEYSRSLIEALEVKTINKLNFNIIKNDLEVLRMEMRTIPFGGGEMVIELEDIATSLPEKMKTILLEEKSAIIIIKAGELSPSSSLRKFFETEKSFYALPCYKDEDNSLRYLIIDSFKKNKVKITSEGIDFLIHHLPSDRLIIRSELDKIFSYLGEKTEITLEELNLILGRNVENIADKLCEAVFSGNKLLTMQYLDQMLYNKTPIINLIRLLIRHLLKLYYLELYQQEGMSIEEAVKKLRPPVFFKQVPALIEHKKIWDQNKIYYFLEQLAILEAECKQTGTVDKLLLQQSYLEIANAK